MQAGFHEPDLSYDDRRAMLREDYALACADWNRDRKRVGGGAVGLHFILPYFELRARGAGSAACTQRAPDFDALDDCARDALQRVWKKSWLLKMPQNAEIRTHFCAILVGAGLQALEVESHVATLDQSMPFWQFMADGIRRDALDPDLRTGFDGEDASCIVYIDYCWSLFRKYRQLDLPLSLWD